MNIIPAVNVDYEEKKKSFYSFYSENERRLSDAADAYANLIRLLVSSSGQDGAKILSRIKNKHECVTKFDIKYRQEIEKSGRNYEIKDEISDLIGVRVICLYESQISIVVDNIKKEFDIVKEEDKAVDLYEKLRFGYKGVHLDLSLNASRKTLPEYKRFADLTFELQIRSIVQDAWSEVDHRLKYKKQIPDNLKRRIVRLAALFELADQEFEEIRKTTDSVESKIREESSGAVLLHSNDIGAQTDETLDAFNFLGFVSKRYPAYVFESHKVDGFVDDLKGIDPKITIKEFARIFNSNYEKTQEYRIDKKEDGISINPYTHIRHIFVAENKEKYSDMLYPKQKLSFIEWLQKNP